MKNKHLIMIQIKFLQENINSSLWNYLDQTGCDGYKVQIGFQDFLLCFHCCMTQVHNIAKSPWIASSLHNMMTLQNKDIFVLFFLFYHYILGIRHSEFFVISKLNYVSSEIKE